MITRIEGTLESVHEASVVIAAGEIAYELFVPSALVTELHARRGERIALHTMHYLESQGQGSSFWPRLVGFATVEDLAFFELITSVKGIGVRRALRALTIPFPRIAEAIVMKDLALLTSLPEIGRKSAETMVLELREKVERFAVRAGVGAGATVGVGAVEPTKGKGKRKSDAPARNGGAAAGSAAGARAGAGTSAGTSAGAGLNAATVMDAVNVLVQLGESRLDARVLIDKAIERDAALVGADTLVAAALACKGSR